MQFVWFQSSDTQPARIFLEFFEFWHSEFEAFGEFCKSPTAWSFERLCQRLSLSSLSLFPQSDARVSTTRKQLIAYPMHSNLSQALDFVLFSQTSEEWKGPLCRSGSFISASPEKAAHKTNQKSSINDLRNEKWSLKRRDKIVTIFILKNLHFDFSRRAK